MPTAQPLLKYGQLKTGQPSMFYWALGLLEVKLSI